MDSSVVSANIFLSSHGCQAVMGMCGMRFSGGRSVARSAGQEYNSDPVELNGPALATLAISMHLTGASKLQTGHPGSRATSYLVPGDRLSATELAQATTVDHWYYMTG